MEASLVEFQSSSITLEDAWRAVLIVHPKDQNLGTIKTGSALGTQLGTSCLGEKNDSDTWIWG